MSSAAASWAWSRPCWYEDSFGKDRGSIALPPGSCDMARCRWRAHLGACPYAPRAETLGKTVSCGRDFALTFDQREGPPNDRRARLLYQSDVARPDRAVDARGDRAALSHRAARLRRDDEGAGLSLDQSDGESAGHPARRYGGDRGRRHLRLSRRCLPRGPSGAAARPSPPRSLLSLDVLRRRSGRGGGEQQGDG